MRLKKYLVLLFIVSNLYIYNYKNNLRYLDEVVVNDSFYDDSVCKNILIIGKINLSKCMNSNDIDKDIVVLFNDKTIVLASHSGNAYNAYFKDLDKLVLGDEVIYYTNNKKNVYSVYDIKNKKKKDNLIFNNIENQLILVTCSYTKKDEQLVYYLLKL